MVNSLLYFFIYLFEVLACYLFFENFYSRRQKTSVCFIVYAVATLFQFGMSFVSIRSINLITFVIATFVIALICYESKIKICIYSTVILTFFMLITEMIIIYPSTYLFKINLAEYENNLLVLVVQASLSKLLFFVVIFFLSKYLKNRATKQSTNIFTVLLGLLPLTSLAIFYTMFYWGTKTSDISSINAALAVCAILLLFANIFVFLIYELVQKTNFENTQLKLENQRSEISKEYYDIMSNDLANSRILVHDIKKHFESLLLITQRNQDKEAVEYLDSISESFNLNTKTKHTGNMMIDVIINRYINTCKAKGIELEIEFCGSRLEFMTDSDIVALLDNMLDNALEAAAVSEKKEILFSMYVQNINYVVIKTKNSCDTKPESKNGKLISSKKDTLSHGIGTQSIKKVVEKYNGDFDWKYHENSKEFEAIAILMINQD